MTPQDIAYLRAKAGQAGYNADDLLKMINYESSGRHNVWGGKGNRYFGLFQAGAPERAKYGVDVANPSATNQIDALFRYLPDRGFKPGMGLMDLYSTVNAGSPGHYNRSDGNGTVASHVAKMMGMSSATPNSVGGNGMSLAYAPVDGEAPAGPLSIDDLLLQQPEPQSQPQQKAAAGLVGLRQAMQEQGAEKANYDDEMRQQMKSLHDQIHAASVAGLLGRM